MAAGTSYYAASPVMRTRSATPVSMNDMSRLLSASQDRKGLGHARTYYNPASQKLYSRYSTKEWEESNKNYFSLSESERNVAERLRSDMWRAVKTTDARTKNRQHANTKKLGNRVSDIAYWKGELVHEMREMDMETENLEEHKRVLEKAYADTKTPFVIAEECLLQREKRQGIDQVHDDVERALSKEVDCIKRCQVKMKALIQKAEVQLKMNRAAQHTCDKDAKDKGHAQHVDDKMYGLRNSSGGIGFHPGVESVDNTVTIPYTWVKYTQENIRRSQHEREMSEKLRGEIDSLLRACANEMWSHFNNVNNAFQSRVQSTQDAKAKLQSHMQRVSFFSLSKGLKKGPKSYIKIYKAFNRRQSYCIAELVHSWLLIRRLHINEGFGLSKNIFLFISFIAYSIDHMS
ncbi:DgyrCDS2128 [Dimorphilus gyrociliatus]|uniref:Tektin n=1 Tax=Dimorphilus gyrociliatus TaxID=2664684 RepID=A0A7I8VEG1_9ANNE|nr:DgyrCDS2128 [Dimorphilus gyrociliatus]